MKVSLGILVACVAVICSVTTASAADQAADKASIEKAIASYTAAFNARDAEALATHWSTATWLRCQLRAPGYAVMTAHAKSRVSSGRWRAVPKNSDLASQIV